MHIKQPHEAHSRQCESPSEAFAGSGKISVSQNRGTLETSRIDTVDTKNPA